WRPWSSPSAWSPARWPRPWASRTRSRWPRPGARPPPPERGAAAGSPGAAAEGGGCHSDGHAGEAQEQGRLDQLEGPEPLGGVVLEHGVDAEVLQTAVERLHGRRGGARRRGRALVGQAADVDHAA